MRHSLLPWAAALFAAACAQEGGSHSGVTVRDSTGITILDNSAPALAAARAWRVDTIPILTIGGDTRESTHQLHRVRDAVRLVDGSIVLADGGSSQLRVYGANGDFLRAIGRPGRGPGEFSDLDAVWLLPPDSIAAHDREQGRVLIFDASGEHARSVTLDPSLQRVRRAPGGDFVGFTWAPQESPRALGEVWWESFRYARYGADGSLTNEIAVLPGLEYSNTMWQDRPLHASRSLGHAAVEAAGPDVLYYSDTRSYRILVHELNGRLARIILRSGAVRAVTGDIRDRYIDERLATRSDPAERAAWARYFLTISFPETLPVWGQLETDPEGNLWAAEFAAPSARVIPWSVFSSAGHWLTDVILPRATVFEVGTRHVLLLRRDALDLERLEVLPIIKP